MVDKEIFEARYAAQSGMTIDELEQRGRIAVPCDCREDDCEGWAFVNREEPWTWPGAFRY